MRSGTVTTADLIPALARYAARVHAAADERHHVASPLGAWMLLALCATAAEGRLRDELTAILGADVDTAAGFAASLLAQSHPGVALGCGVWTSPSIGAEAAGRWLAGLAAGVDRGPLPSQDVLDVWVHKQTRGLIQQFSGRHSPMDVLVLATALGTDVTWQEPFTSVAAAQRGLTSYTLWSGAVERVMRAPDSQHHRGFIAASDRVGDVAVHVADAQQGMSVTSVIAAPDISPADVIATAYEIACGLGVERRSLFDLPLGDARVWRITEESIATMAANERAERYEVVLPAWRAEGSLDLRRPELGFPAVAAALEPVLGITGYEYEASQTAVARYGLEGFAAAALSSLRMARGLPPRRGVRRTATLQFGHPYAVVAVTTDVRRLDRATPFGPWHGVPVYSAWVAEPVEEG